MLSGISERAFLKTRNAKERYGLFNIRHCTKLGMACLAAVTFKEPAASVWLLKKRAEGRIRWFLPLIQDFNHNSRHYSPSP